MPGKLKSLLRKFNSPKEEALSPRAKELPKTSPNGGRDSDTFPDRRSPPKQVLSEGSNGVKGSGHVNGMESVTHLIGSPRGSSPTVTNFGGPLYAANDTARATNDRGLGPIISSISYNSTCPSDLPRDPRYLCLGGDRRLLTGVSEMRHSEDVASRNIDRYGLSPRHGSLHSDGGLETAKGPLDLSSLSEEPRKASVGDRSVGSARAQSYGSITPQTPSTRYSSGTGLATEGSLIDGIFPHVETSEAEGYNRRRYPSRAARDELRLSWQRRKPRDSSCDEIPRIKRHSTGGSSQFPMSEGQIAHSEEMIDLRSAAMDGQPDYNSSHQADLNGVVDLSGAKDVCKFTRWAPAVTHETVKPTEHEIIEERVYREIHSHDVYHHVQPVYETEILPARHFVCNSDDELVEVSADKFPNSTGANQRWFIGQEKGATANEPQIQSLSREPKVIADRTYITPEGFKRRETTILHPTELEDMSNYVGPVIPVHFGNEANDVEAFEMTRADRAQAQSRKERSLTLKELANGLPRPGSSSSSLSSDTELRQYQHLLNLISEGETG